MNKNDDRGWMLRTWDKARSAFGVKQGPLMVKAHSNNNVATPDRTPAPTLNLDKGKGQELVADKGAFLKMPQLTPAQVNAREDRLEQQWSTRQKEYASGTISHTGAVREATTGRTYNRVNSQEKVALGSVNEQKARDHKKEEHVMDKATEMWF